MTLTTNPWPQPLSARGVASTWCAPTLGDPHRSGNLVDLPIDEFDRMFALNVRSVYLAAKSCVPHMGPGSSFVATASTGAVRPPPGRRHSTPPRERWSRPAHGADGLRARCL